MRDSWRTVLMLMFGCCSLLLVGCMPANDSPLHYVAPNLPERQYATLTDTWFGVPVMVEEIDGAKVKRKAIGDTMVKLAPGEHTVGFWVNGGNFSQRGKLLYKFEANRAYKLAYHDQLIRDVGAVPVK